MTRYVMFMKSETVSHQCIAQGTDEDMTLHSYSHWCQQMLSSWCVEEVTSLHTATGIHKCRQ